MYAIRDTWREVTCPRQPAKICEIICDSNPYLIVLTGNTPKQSDFQLSCHILSLRMLHPDTRKTVNMLQNETNLSIGKRCKKAIHRKEL